MVDNCSSFGWSNGGNYRERQHLSSLTLDSNYRFSTAHLPISNNSIWVQPPNSGNSEEQIVLVKTVDEIINAIRIDRLSTLSSVTAIMSATHQKFNIIS